MSTEDNKAIVRRFIDEALLGGNIDLVDELFAPDCVNHAAVPEHRIGFQGLKHVLRGSLVAQPDQKWESQIWVAEGDMVVVHATRTATWQALRMPVAEALEKGHIGEVLCTTRGPLVGDEVVEGDHGNAQVAHVDPNRSLDGLVRVDSVRVAQDVDAHRRNP